MLSNTRVRRGAACLSLALLLLAGCADRPVLGTRQYPEQASIHGQVTDGFPGPGSTGGVAVAAAAGVPRTVGHDTSGRYVARVTELTPPYFLWAPTNNVFMYGVALDTGLVNISPLTTLVAAQLIGRDLGDYYSNLSRSDNPELESITPERVVIAQREVTRLLRGLGVNITTGTADFSTTPFNAAPGDPMYDQITAFNDTLNARGLPLGDLVTQVAQSALLCNIESANLVLGDEAELFCPATRSALEDPGDPSVTVYGFITQADDTLLITTSAGVTTRVSYHQVTGDSLTCSGACGVTVGAFTSDSTVSITFSNTTLTGADGATLSGTLTSAPGGVVLPPLYCATNKFILIHPDRSADAACVGAGSGQSGPWTSYYSYDNQTRYALNYIADGDQLKHFIFSRYDENFYTHDEFACELTDCNGVTIGPVVPDGTGLFFRSITFDHTRLGTINPDGSVSAPYAVLDMKVRVSVQDPIDHPPPDCTGLDSIVVSFSDSVPSFAMCPGVDIGTDSKGSFYQEDGQPGYYFIDANFDNLQLNLNGSEVRNLLVGTNNSGGLGGQCTRAACTGITVSPPNANGEVDISFDNTVLQEYPDTVQLTTLRKITLNGTIHGFPPLPEASRAGRMSRTLKAVLGRGMPFYRRARPR